MTNNTLPEFNESQLIAVDVRSISESNQTKKTKGPCGSTILRFNVSDIKKIKKHMDATSK